VPREPAGDAPVAGPRRGFPGEITRRRATWGVPSPHDALFRRMFADPAHAGPLLRALLPPPLVAAIAWHELVPAPGSRVDENQREEHRDLLFQTRLAGRPALLYLLLEHKSRPDRWTALQVLAYQVGIWRDARLRRPRPKHLPFVVPVVVHCGPRRWTATTNLWSLFDVHGLAPDLAAELQRLVPVFAVAPHDFATRSAAEVRAMTLSLHGLWTIACLQFLATAGANERAFERTLREWADVGRRLMQEPTGQGARQAIQSYILKITRLSRPRLGAVIEAQLGTETMKKFVSTYDRAILEGRAQGEAKGRTNSLLRLITRRFGAPTDDVVARVRAASPAELDRWTDRILDAGSIDELLAD
jgi:hypothetical protein